MALYTVRLLTPTQTVVAQPVHADSAEAACRHPSCVRHRILSARRHWTEWLRLREADLNEQRLLLTQMAMQMTHGGLPAAALVELVERLPTLRRNLGSGTAAELEALPPHELLLRLNLHPFAVALCREGERLGQVPDMLLQAAEFLNRHQQTRQELQGPLLKAVLYALAALAMFAATPFLFQLLLERLSDRVTVPTTQATEALMALHAMLTRYLPVTLAACGLLGFAAHRFWQHLRVVPPMHDVDELVRAQRSAALLAVLAPAFRKGIHLAELVRSLRPLLGTRASQHLYARLRAGHRLSQCLSERYFSRTLAIGLHRFEDAPEVRLPQLFATVQGNLHAEIKWRLSRVVRWSRWFYSALLMLLLYLLMQGFLVPIYSVSVR